MDISVNSNKELLAQFASQVARHPDAVALIILDGTVSYSELQQRSDRIAGALQELGVGAKTGETCLVGLCMPRGTDAVCAMLGILKAGGAYLPIDPGYPLSLQQRMVHSAGLRFLLTDHSTQAAALAASVDHALTIPKLYRHSQVDINPLTPVPGDRLFHVLYTSGSTDEPKGVCGTHLQMQARLEWLWQAFPLSDSDICCQKTALHFVDASLEIFGTLLQGRPLLIAPDSHSTNPERLLSLLSEHGVTRISLVVSQLRALLIADPDFGRRLSQLRLCIVSGERLTGDLVDAFRRALPDASLINLYGCSEVPEISHFEILRHTELAGADAPIGYLISGTEAHIVDEELREIEPGEIGELLVGSHLQARGYLNRPAETAARFIDNPFGGTQRLYRTGDRVRMNPDGLLLFEGRADDQVKVRGHRIEISAVEAALKGCDESLDAVKVVVQEDPMLAENRSLVAFVTPASVDTSRLSAKLRERAPRHMQVQRIIVLDKLPSTPSGKVDRRKLAELAQAGFASRQESTEDTRAIVSRLWKTVLLTDSVGANENFFEIGGDSLRLAQLHQHLRDSFPAFDLSLAELLEYPTVAAQVSYLQQTTTSSPTSSSASETRPRRSAGQPQDIAVIGMACRFPGAATPEDFWANLRAGVDSVSDFSDDELEQPDAQLRNDPNYVKSGAVLADIASFDAEFFGFTDKEAVLLDPQQRLLLECAWEAMERAGIAQGISSNRIGIYAGSSASSYFLNNVATTLPVTEATLAEYQENLANDRNFLATRIAYRLQLTGPAINVQTACSTGLVVVHLACQGLRDGECEVALAGSVALKIPQKTGYLFEEGMIRSPDGRCRAFDAQAEGTLFGNGAGVVLLKPMAAAQADGDPILAVIKGSAVNNDGAVKVGYTAPSVTGQAEVVEAALKAAEVDPRSIGYVEAHGTGTRLGDPIEIAAQTRAYTRRGWTPDTFVNGTQYCAIGSVKTNIGHLDEAAGIAGFIKAVLALQHKEIPPSLHFHTPNPEIDFANSPFYVNARLTPWPEMPEPATPRRAGVSSFGMGGTNCHLVLEEAPASDAEAVAPDTGTAPSRHMLILSAASSQGLRDLVDRYRDWLAAQPSVGLADVCATAAIGRSHLPYRCATIAASVAELNDQLNGLTLPNKATVASSAESGKIAFLFTGQGAQYADMARLLYETCSPFRASIDRCAAILDPVLPKPLLSVMFGSATDNSSGETLLSQTRYTQPALFTVEFALAELWQSWGITPDLVIGHSVGEYVAACVAGVFELEDALHIVAERGCLIQALPAGGGMLAVALDETQTAQRLQSYAGRVCIAAVNSPASTVISGDLVMLKTIAEQLRAQGVQHKRLAVSHAFHSASLEPMLAPFASALGKLRLGTPRIQVISNVTGDVASTELANPDYWVKHTRSTVRFADGIETLRYQNAGIVLEIGPSPALLSMVAEIAEHHDWDADSPVLLPSLRRGRDDWAQLLGSLGRLYERGCDIDWPSLYRGQRWRKLVLPTTPFQRKRCWLDRKPRIPDDGRSIGEALSQAAQRLLAQGRLTEEQLGIVPLLAAELEQQATGGEVQWLDLLYAPTWRRLPIASCASTGNGDSCWVILADQSGVGAIVAAQAEAAGVTVFLLYAGEAFAAQGRNRWTINPSAPEQFSAFWQAGTSVASGRPVQCLVYLWTLDASLPSDEMSAAAIMQFQQSICGGVLGLLPRLDDSDAHGMHLWLVTRGAQAIGAGDAEFLPERLNPLQATLWGLGRSLALEYPQTWGGLIDLNPAEDVAACAQALWNELNLSLPEKSHGEQVALRGGDRYVARLEKVAELPTSTAPLVQAKAAYLITGGLGALGLEIAKVLAGLGARHLILLSRSGVTTAEQRRRLDALRQSGVTIHTPELDVADGQAMRVLFAGLSAEKAPLKGIIHAAGTIASAPSSLPEWSRFSSVLRAKVIGGWNLHRLSRELYLDFFMLFSSASSLLGLSGHADYAAANAFLDALASYRRQLGLPALSVSWGDWSGTGMAASAGEQDAMTRTGLGALPLVQARAALRQLIGERGHLAMIRADWPRFIASFQAHQGFLSACADKEIPNASAVGPVPGADSHTDIWASISTAAEPEREHMLREHLAVMVGKVLGRESSSLDSTGNLLSLGFDSLMLIELRNQLRRDLGLQIALPRMLKGPSIDELVIKANKLFNEHGASSSLNSGEQETEFTSTAPSADKSAGEDQWTTIII
jgi:amino acid adenylation domain-containing protein